MVFCGQCGLQLPSGKPTCPRCGTPTEPEFDLVAEDPHANDPTLAALSSYAPDYPRPSVPSSSPQQQKLVLRPIDNNSNFSPPAANNPTGMMNAQSHWDYQDYPSYDQGTPIQPAQPNIDLSYPAYIPQTSQIDKGHQPVANQYGNIPAQIPVRKGKGRTVALLLILLGLLVVLGALALFVLKQNGLLGGNPTPTPSQQAQALISQYYNAINQKDYRSAYNLRTDIRHTSTSYNHFVAGYAKTQHDDITFDNITPLADGTVKVAITIHANEENTPGTVTQHTYQGYYIVGQQNGVWKILNGNFQQLS